MEPKVVKFPLRGEWVALHTPADKIPTHGTDVMGMRYAYDILQIQWQKQRIKFYEPSRLSYWLKGVRLEECLGYGEALYSPFKGIIVDACFEYPERGRLHPVVDFILGHGKSVKFMLANKPEKNSDLLAIIGNYIIMQIIDKEVFALFAHLRKDSLKVAVGDCVEANQAIAEVGHSGNSTAPHLHFQLMDKADLMNSQGIPCSFEEYEAFNEGKWGVVRCGVPEKRVPIRSCA